MSLNVDKFLIPFLLLVFTYAVIEVWKMPIQARLFPWVIGILGLGFIAWLLLQETWSKDRESKREDDSAADFGFTAEEGSKAGRRRTWEIFGWVYGFILMLWLLGFHVAVPLMVFLYLVQHRERWTVTIGLTVGSAAALWSIFDHLLHLPFPPGVFFDWLGWS